MEDAAGLAGLEDLKVLRSLELDRLLVPASRLLGEEDLHAGWSVSTEHQERPEFLKGGSCQLAALLALASSSLKRNMVRPGLLGAGIIWATGCVTPKAELAPVREDDFPIKLRAFIESDDAIFMAPESDWKELAAGEGASLRQAFKSLSLPEFRAAVDLPDRDWRGSEERPQKWAVRLPEGPLAPVLEAVFSTAGRWEAPSQIDKILAATVRFNHASNGLRLRPDNVDRLNAFLQATRELGDWLFAVDELCALVQGAGTDIAAARALSYASAVSKTQPVFAEPLWKLVVSMGGVDVAERALLDIFRTEGRRDERIALLRSRAASDRVSPTARVAASEECAELLVAAEPFAAIEVWLRLLLVDPSNARALAGVHEVVRSAPATVSVLMDASRAPVLLAVIDALSDAEAANLVDIVIDHGRPGDEDKSLLRYLAGQALTRFCDMDLALRTFARSCQPEMVDDAGVKWVASVLTSVGDVDRFARVFSAAGLQRVGLAVLTAVGADRRKPAALRFRALAQALTFTSDLTQAEATDRSLLSLTVRLEPRQAGIELIPSHPDYSPAVRCALFERALVGARGRQRFSLLFDFGNFLLRQGRVLDALDRYRESLGLSIRRPSDLMSGIATCASQIREIHQRAATIDAAALWSLGAASVAVGYEYSEPRIAFYNIVRDFDDWLDVILAIEERSHGDADARVGSALLLDLSQWFLRQIGDPEFALDLWCRAWRLERGLPSARSALQQVLKGQRSHASTRTRWRGATVPHPVGFHDGIASIDLVAFADDKRPRRAVDDPPPTERFPLSDAAWGELVVSFRNFDPELLGRAATTNGDVLRTELLGAAASTGQWAECVAVLCQLEALHGGGEYLHGAAEITLTRLGQPRRALELFRRASVHRTAVGAAPFTLSCAQEDDDLDEALVAIGEIRHHFSEWERGPADTALLMSLADLQWDCSRNAVDDARCRMALIAGRGDDDRPVEALVRLARETSDVSWVAKSLGSMPSRAVARIVERVRQYVDDLAAQHDGPELAGIVLVAELLLACNDANAAFDRLAPEASRFFKDWRFRVQLRSVARRSARLAEAADVYQHALDAVTDEASQNILSAEINRCRRRST